MGSMESQGSAGAAAHGGSSSPRTPGRFRGIKACLTASATILFLFVATAHAGAATWHLQSAPAPQGPSGQLFSISCSSSTSCMGVGFYLDPTGVQKPLAETWNGTSWAVKTVPMPSGVLYGSLHGVSCTSATACTAVGGAGPSDFPSQPLAERWNGSSWTLQSVPSPSNAADVSFNSVSCSSSTRCTAVGNAFDTLAGHGVGVAERWNGSWTAQTLPDPSGSTNTALNGVSCPTSSVCTAVGDYTTKMGSTNPNKTLAERWNGTSWAIKSTPNPTGTTAATLQGVSCSAASACTSVGGYATAGSFANQTLAERWNGSSWAIQTTTNPGAAPTLSGVSCPTATDCTAVGAPLGTTPVVEQWNGTAWTTQSAPLPSGLSGGQLTAVSCTAATACTAAGGAAGGIQLPQTTLAERWNGTSWKVQTSANQTGAEVSFLNATSCPTSSACTAVGYLETNAGALRMLAEAWDGTNWTVQSMPNPATSNGILNAVSCTGPPGCSAVGSYVAGGSQRTLAERWNGASWTVQSTPNPSTPAVLQGVSCTSNSSCMAVGRFFNTGSGHEASLAEHWDGSSWTVKTPQNVSGQTFGTLNGVSCTSSSACAAVGGYSTTPNAVLADKLLAEQWNGTSWAIKTTPAPGGTTFATFTGVSCGAVSACTAAGGFATTVGAAFPSAPLAERWDGSTWTIQATPNPASTGFSGVSCPGSSWCTAVGGFGNIFAEGWNGTSWTSQTLASPSPNAGQMLGVSCSTATACTAAGQSLSNYFLQPLFASTMFVGVMDVPLVERWH